MINKRDRSRCLYLIRVAGKAVNRKHMFLRNQCPFSSGLSPKGPTLGPGNLPRTAQEVARRTRARGRATVMGCMEMHGGKHHGLVVVTSIPPWTWLELYESKHVRRFGECTELKDTKNNWMRRPSTVKKMDLS